MRCHFFFHHFFKYIYLYFTGKVSIRKDDLCKYSGKDNWFNLQPVDPNTEVQVIFLKRRAFVFYKLEN